jgi:YesN/AraC family two-component response regulator
MARILIIDDDRQIRNMLKQILSRAGYEVVEAHDGVEGLRAFRTSPTDLVITDILMPEKEGLETIQELRQLSPQLQILALSGGGERGNFDFLQVAKKLGAQHTMRKPVAREALLDTIAQMLPGTPLRH